MTAVLKVLLLLLKWLGILLLMLLGLILAILLLVLLVPIRYKGRLDKKEAPEEGFRADGLISWLNPFVRVKIRYKEKKLHYTVRLFGICLKNSDKPKKEKKQKEKKKHSKKREKTNRVAEGSLIETDVVSIKPEENPTGGAVETGEEALPAEMSTESGMRESAEAVDGEASAEEKKKKPSVFVKIKQFFEKIKSIPEKVKQKVTKIIETLKLLWHKKEKTIAFFEDELHRTAIGTVWDSVKRVLRHVLPGKIKGHVEFGTGDPESTGKALGVMGMLYAWYGKGLTVVPDFDEKRIVAELDFKGRIRCGTLLVMVWRLMRDQQVKRLRNNFKKLMTVLKQKAE